VAAIKNHYATIGKADMRDCTCNQGIGRVQSVDPQLVTSWNLGTPGMNEDAVSSSQCKWMGEETSVTLGLSEHGLDLSQTAPSIQYVEAKQNAYGSFQPSIDGARAWFAATGDLDPWFELRTGNEIDEWIGGIVSQGAGNVDQWVSSYSVKYWSDTQGATYLNSGLPPAFRDRYGHRVKWAIANAWSDVDNGHVFTANNNSHTKVTVIFEYAVWAKKVRLYPKSWHNWIAMRVQLANMDRQTNVALDKAVYTNNYDTQQPGFQTRGSPLSNPHKVTDGSAAYGHCASTLLSRESYLSGVRVNDTSRYNWTFFGTDNPKNLDGSYPLNDELRYVPANFTAGSEASGKGGGPLSAPGAYSKTTTTGVVVFDQASCTELCSEQPECELDEFTCTATWAGDSASTGTCRCLAGWDANQKSWFTVDLGKPTTLAGVQLAGFHWTNTLHNLTVRMGMTGTDQDAVCADNVTVPPQYEMKYYTEMDPCQNCPGEWSMISDMFACEWERVLIGKAAEMNDMSPFPRRESWYNTNDPGVHVVQKNISDPGYYVGTPRRDAWTLDYCKFRCENHADCVSISWMHDGSECFLYSQQCKDNTASQTHTKAPTRSPTKAPTRTPTVGPSKAPTYSPTVGPTESPTPAPPITPSYQSTGLHICTTTQQYCGDVEQLDEINVVGKPAQQSSDSQGGVASRAVDGDVVHGSNSSSCISTQANSAAEGEWWRLDLQSDYVISQVKVFNREWPYSGRLDGFRVGVSTSADEGEACAANIPVTNWDMEIPIDCEGRIGRYITVSLPGPGTALTICEVKVYGVHATGQHAQLVPGTSHWNVPNTSDSATSRLRRKLLQTTLAPTGSPTVSSVNWYSRLATRVEDDQDGCAKRCAGTGNCDGFVMYTEDGSSPIDQYTGTGKSMCVICPRGVPLTRTPSDPDPGWRYSVCTRTSRCEW
jgi:hypothetical protein